MITDLYSYQLECDGCGKKKVVSSTQSQVSNVGLPKGWISVPYAQDKYGPEHYLYWSKKDYCTNIKCQDMAASLIAADELRKRNEHMKRREQIT